MSTDEPAPRPSTWQIVRKRAAPLGLVLALVWLGTRSCGDQPATARVHLGIGSAPVTHLRVVAQAGDRDEDVAHFEQFDLNGPAPVWRLEVMPGSYRLQFVVGLRGQDASRRFERRIEVSDGADIRVDLTRDLQ
jgi:hypothetical protein